MDFNPNWTTPPGSTIADWMEERRITEDELANSLEIDKQDVFKLLIGDLEINSVLAGHLNNVIGGSVEFWLDREKNYREDLKMGREKLI